MSTIDRYIEQLENRYPDTLLNTSDLAETLSVSESALSIWRSAGEGPPYFKLGGKYKYLKADVISWIRNHYIENEDFTQKKLIGGNLEGE